MPGEFVLLSDAFGNPAYAEAIAGLKKDGVIPEELEHRQVKYLNNRLESDHGKLNG